MTDIDKLQKQIKQEQDEMLEEYKRLNKESGAKRNDCPYCVKTCETFCRSYQQ